MRQMKSKVTGKVYEVVEMNEPLSKGYTLGIGKNPQGITLKSGDDYGFVPENKLHLWEEV